MLTTYLIVAVVAYLLGSIPFGYILVKLFLKQDIRQTGSGNIGATNVARSGAKGLAIATLLLDAGKGFLAVLITFLYCEETMTHWRYMQGVDCHALRAWAALFAVLGHCFPVWLKFKGGKGVATGIGAFIVISPQSVLLALLVFAVVLAFTRYVSLASILATVTFFAASLYSYIPASWTVLISISGACLTIILKHHANIRRLLNGTEHKFGTPKVPADPIQTEKQI